MWLLHQSDNLSLIFGCTKNGLTFFVLFAFDHNWLQTLLCGVIEVSVRAAFILYHQQPIYVTSILLRYCIKSVAIFFEIFKHAIP